MTNGQLAMTNSDLVKLYNAVDAAIFKALETTDVDPDDTADIVAAADEIWFDFHLEEHFERVAAHLEGRGRHDD